LKERAVIISASRRTDIPAFYTPWFMNRIRAGYCTVPNPYNPSQIAHVSLRPDDVDAIAFSTRNPRPLMPHLMELNQRSFRYYFMISIINNPRWLDEKSPSLHVALDAFKTLSDVIGPERAIWRYDPIVFSKELGVQYHMDNYRNIAESLRGYTQRGIVSILDDYKKARGRMQKLNDSGINIIQYAGKPSDNFGVLMRFIAETAEANGIAIQSCAEPIDLRPYGIPPGACLDGPYIERTFGIPVTHKKDPSMRDVCGCVVTKDIGMYDMCLFGCQYCYATTNFARARANNAAHNPESPSLLGWHEAQPKQNRQLNLFAGSTD
jgi:hypothetical protein